MSEGKSFHIRAPATGKARRPIVESLTTGTNRLSVVENRSLYRDGMSAVRVNCRSSVEKMSRCKLPQRDLGHSPSRNRNWCILALKSYSWW